MHVDDTPPNCYGLGVIHEYHHYRPLIRQELAAMRAAGMRALRTVFVHSTEGDPWSYMPSAGGRLPEPYRTNLANFLRDVRAAGFQSFTLVFQPFLANDPIDGNPWGHVYDPSKFEENWQLISDLRPLVKEHGPPITRFDLLGEGAPDSWQPQLREYVKETWKRYVDAFGSDDATISVIANPYGVRRLPNLVDALRETGRPLPKWFDVHPTYLPSERLTTLVDLRRVDDYLTSEHLTQPLVIGEETYDSSEAAAAIATFMETSLRPVLEVTEWPLTTPGPPWSSCPNPPYRIAAYQRALTREAPYTLTARFFSDRWSMTSAGVEVTALAAGRYTVVVNDTSSRNGFRLVAPSFNRRTGARFRGRVMWRVRLQHFDEVRYGALHGRLARVDVLGDGGR
jgi:hypothetical protein